MTAAEALQVLKDGNRRFVENCPTRGVGLTVEERNKLSEGQKPFAVLLGCSDSRVPVETIFDQGFGALFVVRIAGNVVRETQIGSVEFAIEQFGAPLVVVLGHSGCGAIAATLDFIRNPSNATSPSQRFLVETIEPGLSGVDLSHPDAAAQAVRANVNRSVAALQDSSGLIRDKVNTGSVSIVGAEYDLQTGEVHF